MKVVMFPGQGSQYKGMGKDLFRKYAQETQKASEILGYDIEELCVNDPEKKLSFTQYTQPALFVVNALAYYERKEKQPDFFIGHSLGEYNALHAAGVFDFETGVRLVQKRGALMAAASGGAMAAVVGISAEELRQALKEGGHTAVEVANFNSPLQTVVAGKQDAIDHMVKEFGKEGIRAVPLMVSAPFHSSYMQPAATEFAGFLKQFSFNAPEVKVIANATAMPYGAEEITDLLSRQIASSVQWTDTIRLLMGYGVTAFEEIGGVILTRMCDDIRKKCTPIEPPPTVIEKKENINGMVKETFSINGSEPKKASALYETKFSGAQLGSSDFRNDYAVRYAYCSGAMYRGIASAQMVIKMGKAGLMGFLGTGGMSLSEIEANIKQIQSELRNGESYGLNLLHNLIDPEMEMRTVELYLKHGVRRVEAAAYMQITEALVYFRAKGLRQEGNTIVCDHTIMAKVSRPEIAELFMKPAPEKMIRRLLDRGLISEQQATFSQEVPLSYDICVEADSGGHTDGGVALVLLPSIQQLRSTIEATHQYTKRIRVGLAGGIGTPQAVACAFMMKADFVLTGSVNQCTVEAGTSDAVKDLLQEINVQDTDYAPAGDMFELGAKVQVLKKGVLFPARANKLYALYQQYESIESIPEKNRVQLEKNYFKRPLNEVWEETRAYFRSKGEEQTVTRAEQNAKEKMALVFRWYFGFSNRVALEGNLPEKVNFQVHTGPALGSFNQWVKGTPMESWRNRHVDEIAERLMEGAAALMKEQLTAIIN